ncbi:MAG TPA: amino acid ABC transporter ATP-binding protein [Candidatus Faecisoma merdavium]|nr:amino acid ABC transporter ATP-binding protein [Candidatus Faecisoma merdavium]
MYEVKKLVKKFDKVKVLKEIDLDIKEGEKIVIIGPSGSGKSTLLRCLGRLESPTSGKIYFDNKDITKIHNTHEIGMVFQSFNLFENLTVLENITLAPIKTKLLSKQEAIKKAKEYLKQIKLEDKENNYPADLSGGQKQRVAIIRALMTNPKVILFDEPTSALDREMIEEVLNLMEDVAKEGMTMIVVTHELNFASNFATKIIFMNEGKILESGSPKELFNNPKTERLKEFLKG